MATLSRFAQHITSQHQQGQGQCTQAQFDRNQPLWRPEMRNPWHEDLCQPTAQWHSPRTSTDGTARVVRIKSPNNNNHSTLSPVTPPQSIIIFNFQWLVALLSLREIKHMVPQNFCIYCIFKTIPIFEELGQTRFLNCPPHKRNTFEDMA